MQITSAPFRERLKRLHLDAERLRRRHRTGQRQNQHFGTGLEFAGHRQYAPGDDVRFLDWNALGRLDQLVLKVFDAPNQLNVVLALDSSATLDFGEPKKLDLLKEIGAAIGYLSLASNDRLTLASIGGPSPRSFSSINQAQEFLQTLEKEPASGEANIDAWLAGLARQRGDTLVVLLTDFQAQERTRRLIQEAVHHRAKVLVLQVWSPEEREPELEGNCLVSAVDHAGLATKHKVQVTPALLERYAEERDKWRRAIAHFCQRLQAAHLEMISDQQMEDIVLTLVEAGILRVNKA